MLQITPLCLAFIIATGATPLAAQTAPKPSPPASSALDGETFYQVLLGELNVQGNEPGTGFALILDAARKTNDASLYQRATEVALQARSGDAALQAARAWKRAHPGSRDANRFVLQILVALNRLQDLAEPLHADIALAPPADRNTALSLVPRHFARATDRKLVASEVEKALGEYLRLPATSAAAWTVVGRLRLAAGDKAGALDAAQRAQSADALAEGPALLALELMSAKTGDAESLVQKHLQGKPRAELRMGYARALLDEQRYAESARQLLLITAERPDFAEAWLVLGTLQTQDNQVAAAEASLKRYVELAPNQQPEEARRRGLTQAYLSLSQIAEKRKDFAGAEAWLDRIDNRQELISIQSRRASILARQGKIREARALLQALPARDPADARAKLLAEVQMLRDVQQYQAAYDLLLQAIALAPNDTDLLYDQAMLAEKLERLDEMERLLRQLIAAKPNYHHAYNALGYSLADRNVRLPEARQLIQKALEFAPGDPFISDSLGWVEFRMGNKPEALRILDAAFKSRPDAEIAAHLGEVLWSLGQRERALSIWKEGLLLNATNETLLATLKRFGIKP